MKKAVVLYAVAALVLIFAGVAYTGDVEQGKAVYAAQKCKMCHSIDGVGGKMSALDEVGSKLKAEEIQKWIKTPKAMKADSKMKAYPSLPDKELADLTAYMLSLQKK